MAWYISWQIEGEKVEAATDFIFLGSKIMVDGAQPEGEDLGALAHPGAD